MSKFINTLASFLGERVDILVMPRKGASFKFKLRRITLLIILLVWLLITGAGVLFFIRGYDYNMIKTDNNLMRMKMQLIADELERGRKYIELTRTTDTQMRQMLGMPGSKSINLPKGWEEAQAKADQHAKELLSTDLKDMETEDFGDYVDDLEENAKARLASFQEIAWYFANNSSFKRTHQFGLWISVRSAGQTHFQKTQRG